MDIFIILYKIKGPMKITAKFGIVITVIVIIFTIFSGCTSNNRSNSVFFKSDFIINSDIINELCFNDKNYCAPQTTVPQTTAQPMGDFSTVTHIDVTTIEAHWSSGAEKDGITVHPNLLDIKGQTVMWSGVTLPVTIEIYSTKLDANYKQVKDQLVVQRKWHNLKLE